METYLVRDYLAELYPKADDETLDLYEELVRTNDSEKLPPTAEALKYIKITNLIKKLQDRQAKLREDVLYQYKTLNHQISGLSISTPNPRSFDKDSLFSWVTSKYGQEFLDDCRSTIVDKDKVDAKIVNMILKEELSIEELPQEVFKQGSQYRLEVSGSRKHKS